MSNSVEANPVPQNEDEAYVVHETDEQELTYVRTKPACIALAHGLAQYLSHATIEWAGREISFLEVLYTWADPETMSKYPSCAIVMNAPVDYDDSRFTPQTVEIYGTNKAVRVVAEAQAMLAITVWANNKHDRDALATMLEDVLEPLEDCTGLRLALPSYFGAHATYEKLSSFYDDDTQTAQTKRLRATFVVRANVPQIVPVGEIVRFKPKACVIVDGVSDPELE